MNILYISGFDLDACSCGGHQRSRLMYESLCRIGRTYVLCADPDAHVVPGERMTLRRTGLGPVRRFVDRVCSAVYARLFPRCPRALPFRWSLNVEEAFPGISFDCVIVRYPHEAAISAPWRYGRLFVDFDDHPLEQYLTMEGRRHGALRRWLSGWVFRWAVGRVVRRCEGAWVSNPGQVTDFPAGTKVYPLENIPYQIPCEGDFAAAREGYLMAVGAFAWEPNRDGVAEFLREIWPSVRARHPELEFRIVGGGLADDVRRDWESLPGVSCLGFVDDIGELYAHALASVAPVTSGGGTCIKTRESQAFGRVCLSTEFGVRGLPPQDLADNGILIYHSSDEFVEQLAKVVDERVRGRLERRARAYAEVNFSRSKFAEQVATPLDRTLKECSHA